MEQLQHFSHDHVLNLVRVQSNNLSENPDEEENDEDEFVVEMGNQHHGQCNMCKEEIYSFHLSYYQCKVCDHYLLHTYCAQLPKTFKNHPSHPDHNLTLRLRDYDSDANLESGTISRLDIDLDENSDIEIDLSFVREWMCDVCHLKWKKFFYYHCSICNFNMDIICATISKQKMYHPSHPHQLERILKSMLSYCHACGNEHKGTFYYCTTCFQYWISLDCALLPHSLLIQQTTNGTFHHSHPLILAYSFPYLDQKAKFHPTCKVCGDSFSNFLWIYKCDKCRYYVHVDCGTSKRESFMSIFLPPGLGKLVKNYEDEDHPNLVHCPFDNESENLLKHLFFNQKDTIDTESDGEILNQSNHRHHLILLDTEELLSKHPVTLHNPLKKIQLLCDGCVKPVTTLPFYMCSEDVPYCGFVLHEWCARLPSQIEEYPGHPEHTLHLLPNIPYFYGIFLCDICKLPSNGFGYGCTMCGFYVDINCAFIPEEITHESHPNHLLSRIDTLNVSERRFCNACRSPMEDGVEDRMGFQCFSCDLYLHAKCALLLPKLITHKYDKNPLSLRYYPVENHIGEYFCEICEDEIDPRQWFYHCTTSVQSMHTSCAPVIVKCEQAIYSMHKTCVFPFINFKFGRMFEIIYHEHRLSLTQGINDDGKCRKCDSDMKAKIIFKCFKCKFAIHWRCTLYHYRASISLSSRGYHRFYLRKLTKYI